VSGHMEAKKHAYRQTQDGVVISFVVHPSDVNPALAAAALGTVYMLGWAEVEPGEQKPKEQRSWADLRPSQQAGIACGDPAFQHWLADYLGYGPGQDFSDEWAAVNLRSHFGVDGRKRLNDDDLAPTWRAFYAKFLRDTGKIPEER
jgi:hypothetical protein